MNSQSYGNIVDGIVLSTRERVERDAKRLLAVDPIGHKRRLSARIEVASDEKEGVNVNSVVDDEVIDCVSRAHNAELTVGLIDTITKGAGDPEFILPFDPGDLVWKIRNHIHDLRHRWREANFVMLASPSVVIAFEHSKTKAFRKTEDEENLLRHVGIFDGIDVYSCSLTRGFTPIVFVAEGSFAVHHRHLIMPTETIADITGSFRAFDTDFWVEILDATRISTIEFDLNKHD